MISVYWRMDTCMWKFVKGRARVCWGLYTLLCTLHSFDIILWLPDPQLRHKLFLSEFKWIVLLCLSVTRPRQQMEWRSGHENDTFSLCLDGYSFVQQCLNTYISQDKLVWLWPSIWYKLVRLRPSVWILCMPQVY